MLLLAIDSAQRQGSISLVEGEDGRCEVLKTVAIEGGTFSAQFIPQLSRILSELNLTKERIGGFACASGPGSFTGLRVGLAAIKALAEVLARPIIAVSTLECVASFAGEEHEFVISALDAGRGEMYLGEYKRERHLWHSKREFLATREEFAAFLRGFDVPPPVLTTGAVLADEARAAGALNVVTVSGFNSETVARLAFRKLAAGESVSVDALDANYVRRDQRA